MREIEIKARVKNPAQTLAALEKNGVKLGEPKKQHDVVYSRPGAIDNDPNENWLRVRTENDQKVIFTLKRSVNGELDSIEHEVEVSSEDEITAIIKCLGYKLFSDLTKIRRKGNIDGLEFCYDDLQGLGTFIEVEKLCHEDEDGDAVVRELWAWFEKLDIPRKDEETHGYDVLKRMQEGKAQFS